MTNRIQRINEDIKREIVALLRNIKDPRITQQTMISVTAVETSGDLGQAKIYLSAYNLDSNQELMKGLKSASGYLRYELGKALSLRHTPELKFILDDSIERGARINTILSGIEVKEDARLDGIDDSGDISRSSEEDT